MREILFRGKRIENGEWCFGYLFDDGMIDSNRMFVGNIVIEDYKGNADDVFDITGIDFCEVTSETICQYTGLTDKAGRKIFEGDILSFTQKGQKSNGVVKMIDGCFFAIIEGQRCWLSEGVKRYKGKVIGNIFDNPELMQVI